MASKAKARRGTGSGLPACKLVTVEGFKTYQLKAADQPVPLIVRSAPPQCQFKFGQINVLDQQTNVKVWSKSNINAATANLGGSDDNAKVLTAGTYRVFLNILPAATYPGGGGDPYNGGTAKIYENCTGNTLLYLAGASDPNPEINLVVI